MTTAYFVLIYGISNKFPIMARTVNTFEYRHDTEVNLELVNGSYALGEIKHIAVDSRDILYRIGTASLDNSCCGNYGCSYVLVIGERLEGRAAADGAQESALVREISMDEALADATRSALIEREAVGNVNFYLAPTL